MLNSTVRKILWMVCVIQIAAILLFELPDWLVIATMIAPIVLLVDYGVTFMKGRAGK